MIKKTNFITKNPREIVISFFMLFSLFLIFPQQGNANEQETKAGITEPGKVLSSGTDLWRNVRQRNEPYKGDSQILRADAGYMIDTQGEVWRDLRVDKIIPYSTYLLGLVLVAIFLFRLIRGEIKIDAGRSGKQILRFTTSQRFIHWGTAILFLILAFTGIILLLGRSLLMPLIGSNAFSAIASIGKVTHDYCGSVFAIFLLLMLIKFIKGNFYKRIYIRKKKL